MAAALTRWERRDGADRQEMAMAAIALCRASRASGAKASRFFWTTSDSIVTLTEADSPAFFEREPDADTAKAVFALSDLARSGSQERWIDPRDGQSAYRTAGR